MILPGTEFTVMYIINICCLSVGCLGLLHSIVRVRSSDLHSDGSFHLQLGKFLVCIWPGVHIFVLKIYMLYTFEYLSLLNTFKICMFVYSFVSVVC